MLSLPVLCPSKRVLSLLCPSSIVHESMAHDGDVFGNHLVMKEKKKKEEKMEEEENEETAVSTNHLVMKEEKKEEKLQEDGQHLYAGLARALCDIEGEAMLRAARARDAAADAARARDHARWTDDELLALLD